MRYINGDGVEKKIKDLIYHGIKYNYNCDYLKGLEEASRIVRRAHTLKDPAGKNYLTYMTKQIDILSHKNTELRELINTFETGRWLSEKAEMEKRIDELKQDNLLLREAYIELNEKLKKEAP